MDDHHGLRPHSHSSNRCIPLSLQLKADKVPWCYIQPHLPWATEDLPGVRWPSSASRLALSSKIPRHHSRPHRKHPLQLRQGLPIRGPATLHRTPSCNANGNGTKAPLHWLSAGLTTAPSGIPTCSSTCCCMSVADCAHHYSGQGLKKLLITQSVAPAI